MTHTKERLMKVLLSPHVSEKSTMVAEQNQQIVFKVVPDADKHEIKAAVELLFDVKVKDVNTVNRKGKVKRFGQRLGKRSGMKRAFVSLEPGYDINFMSEA